MRVKPELNIMQRADEVQRFLCHQCSPSECPDGTNSECDNCIFDAPIEEFKEYLLEQLKRE